MLAQQLDNGALLGATYALFALGFTLMFGVLRVINLTYGFYFSAGALLALWMTRQGAAIWLALPMAALGAGCIAVALDWVLLARLRRRKAELLRILQHPEIPLHTNGSENDIRACVTKRKISGGTMSTAGRTARDVMLGLMKACSKLGVSFYRYLGDRLHVPGSISIPPLPNLVRQAVTPAGLPGDLLRLRLPRSVRPCRPSSGRPGRPGQARTARPP